MLGSTSRFSNTWNTGVHVHKGRESRHGRGETPNKETLHIPSCTWSFLIGTTNATSSSEVSNKITSISLVKTFVAKPWQSKSVGSYKHNWQELWSEWKGEGETKRERNGGSVWKNEWGWGLEACHSNKARGTKEQWSDLKSLYYQGKANMVRCALTAVDNKTACMSISSTHIPLTFCLYTRSLFTSNG